MAETIVQEIDLSTMKQEVLAQLRADAAAEAAAKVAKEAELKALREEVETELRGELETEYQAKLDARKKAPAYNTRVGKRSKSEGTDEFLHWMATGDNGSMKVLKPDRMGGAESIELDLPSKYQVKALQEGSDTEGGYLVPDDFVSTIVSMREQFSWVRQAGVNVIQTNLDTVNIPTEATALANLTATAEEGAYTTNDPLFGQVAISIYKFTKLTKISEELLADDAAGMEQWYARRLAEVAASTESYYVAIGTGSSQPQGVFVGGTAGLTFDSTGNITADEIPELFYKLQKQYRAGASWLMNGEVEGYLRMIRDANNWAFDPWGAQMGVRGVEWMETLYGRPVFNDEGCATIATSAKVILVGDFSFYTLAERKGISISRNPYLYQANGQVGFFSNFRWGGAVTQAEAFQYGTMA
jgi:HK97 family phage major capsid protein